MNKQELNCSIHPNEKFQYFCLKEECIQQKPTKCQLFYCPLCYEDLDENNQLFNHQIYDINILNKKNKKNIFKNKQAVGDKLWEMIKQKYNGNIENFENDCIEINQKFNENKQKQLDNMISVQNHINILKQQINLQLDLISKNIKVKIEECRNLYTPTDIMKFINQKTSDFQQLLGMLVNEPKQNLQFYKNSFQNQLNSIREDTKNLLVATQFSKQITEQNLEKNLNIYLQYSTIDQEQAEQLYISQRSQILDQQIQQQQNQLQDQQQKPELNFQQSDFDEKNIQLLIFQELNYTTEMGTQINDKIKEFKDYMNQQLQVSQSKTQPLNQVLQNNLEISQQVQQLVQLQQEPVQKNEEQFQNDQNNNNTNNSEDLNDDQDEDYCKEFILQYNDLDKFLEDFQTEYNQQQQIQSDAITDLRLQFGLYHDIKNSIQSYGYNKQDIEKIKLIDSIIFQDQQFKNLKNLTLNYDNSGLNLQYHLSIIRQLDYWTQSFKLKKISLGYQNNGFYQLNISKIIQKIFSANLIGLRELELTFKQNQFSNLYLFSHNLINYLKEKNKQNYLQQDEYEDQNSDYNWEFHEELESHGFNLYDLEIFKIDFSMCLINNTKLAQFSEQIALLGICMPRLQFLEIQLAGNDQITDKGINTFTLCLANSLLLKNLKTISLNFNDNYKISDNSLIQLSEILASKGKSLNAIYFYVQATNVSSPGIKKISQILSQMKLKKMAFDFSINDQLNGQEILEVAQSLTQTKLQNPTNSLNHLFFHQNLTGLCIRFSRNPSQQHMLQFFNILTNKKYFPLLSSLQIDAYNNKLNDNNFLTIWNNLTNPESLTNLKYLNLCLAGKNISPESQVLASLKIAQTSKFQNLEELLLSYDSSSLNKYVNNQICAVNIVQNLVNSENLKKLKHLSLDLIDNNLKSKGCQQVVEELSKPKNKLSLEQISLNFEDNGVYKNQIQKLNNKFRDSLITEQLRVANIYFDVI